MSTNTIDHAIQFTFERDTVRLHLVCNAEPDAACRWTADCGCETATQERDAQGWFHVVYNPAFDLDGPNDETNPEEVEHRHTIQAADGRACNIQNWINADDPAECGPRTDFEIASVPVELLWEGDYFSWAPAKS